MKLIGLDVDGTLINTKKEITKRTKDSLIKAMNQGHKVAIVSGRPTAGVIDLAKDLEFETYGGLLSNFNGGMISDYKTKKILVSHTLDRDLALEIIDFTKDLDIEIMIPHMDNIYTRKAGEYAVEEARYLGLNLVVEEDLSKILDFAPNKFLFAKDPDKIDKVAQKIYQKFGAITEQVKSSRFYYEVMPKGLSKGKSLLEIAKIFSIDPEDIIAFGDEMNDASMLEMAGTGVAMGNAVEPIKKIADYTTLSNDEDGIAYYLEKFILS